MMTKTERRLNHSLLLVVERWLHRGILVHFTQVRLLEGASVLLLQLGGLLEGHFGRNHLLFEQLDELFELGSGPVLLDCLHAFVYTRVQHLKQRVQRTSLIVHYWAGLVGRPHIWVKSRASLFHHDYRTSSIILVFLGYWCCDHCCWWGGHQRLPLILPQLAVRLLISLDRGSGRCFWNFYGLGSSLTFCLGVRLLNAVDFELSLVYWHHLRSAVQKITPRHRVGISFANRFARTWLGGRPRRFMHLGVWCAFRFRESLDSGWSPEGGGIRL